MKTVSVVTSTHPVQLIAAGDGPTLLFNTDANNAIYLSNDYGMNVSNSDSVITFPALATVVIDGKQDVYAAPVNPAITVQIDIIPGGLNFFQLVELILKTLIVAASQGNGVYVYTPSPGAGKLIASIVGSNGNDPFGDFAIQGIASYNGNIAMVLNGASLVAYYNVSGTQTNFNISQFAALNGGVISSQSLMGLQAGTGFYLGSQSNDTSGVITLVPSGDATGATDIVLINAALALTGCVQLLPGTYFVNAPITPPKGSSLTGCGCIVNNSLRTPAGTTIKAVAAFAGTGVIQQVTVAASPIGNFRLSNLHIDLSAAANTTHGIHAFSNVYGNVIEDVSMLGPAGAGTGIGLNMVFDGTSGQPDGWRINGLLIIAMGNGWFAQAADMVIRDLHIIQSVSDGARIRTLANSTISDSRVANGGANGWNFGDSGTGSASPDATITMVGCDSQINNGTGLLIDWPAGGGQIVNIAGYTSVNDGQSGGVPAVSIAGGSAAGSTDISSLSIAANGTGPVTAFSAAGASNWSLVAGSLWATTNTLVNTSTGIFEYRALKGKIGAGAWAAIADNA